ncbi:uncharacterized protein LOC103715480 [Phoenix dactylifera]|uniref:Uncharacterized protein LOC103715480 n=1 Tax=Phoenix dactylifera TaxID=42345 RepID=A0A8B7CLA1_PHODC|nr:uncharacterized protein LOC103715480 [Phoenix dactylifera]
MRIRKCASKLLGATIAYFSPPKPFASPAWDSQAASAAAAGILCQLNRSPWDLIPNHQNAVSQQEDADADPAADDDRGAAANRIKPERKPVEPPLIKSDVKIKAEAEEEEEKVRKKVKRKRVEKGSDSTAATKTGETATPLCKKSDGKGWHCKRLAHLPHSLCHYHLTQLRSYANNSSYRKVADGGGDRHRKKKATADAAGDGNNFYYYYYYYYSAFGPWRGKRRGSNYRSDNFGGGITGDVAEEGGRENSESVDGHDAPATGDDEEDNEEEVDGKGCCGEEDKSDEDEEERNCRKKRGRKPVKARSLKSLL